MSSVCGCSPAAGGRVRGTNRTAALRLTSGLRVQGSDNPTSNEQLERWYIETAICMGHDLSAIPTGPHVRYLEALDEGLRGTESTTPKNS